VSSQAGPVPPPQSRMKLRATTVNVIALLIGYSLGSLRATAVLDLFSPLVPRPSFSPSRQARNIVPLICTQEQLAIIKQQLPPDECLTTQNRPWMQRCSLTKETKCPDATWINDYYHTTSRATFLGISVGCNKAFDAIDTMRRGSGDEAFDKKMWRDALQEASGGEVAHGVCNQDTVPQFDLSLQNYATTRPIQAEMHCVEPMPMTAIALQAASDKLGLGKRGFVVSHAAIAKTSGSVYFPKASLSNQTHMKVQVGSENQGIETCNGNPSNPNCQSVRMYSLDDYVRKFVKHDVTERPINILSVDVEGFDYDVLLGGMNNTLPRVEYLEFEYNWMGSWKNQELKDAVNQLDQQGFTCFWAGSRGRLWQITGCFMETFEVKHWSNVACVNRDRVPDLAVQMEETFLQTLVM